MWIRTTERDTLNNPMMVFYIKFHLPKFSISIHSIRTEKAEGHRERFTSAERGEMLTTDRTPRDALMSQRRARFLVYLRAEGKQIQLSQ
jgi:hypothetical protein